MSKLTKEWLKEIISGLEDLRDPMLSFLDDDQGKTYEAFKVALASLEAEPVADVVAWSSPNEERKCDIRWRRHDVAPGPLFTYPPSAIEFPETLPCPVLLKPGLLGKGVRTRTMLDSLQRRADYTAMIGAMTPEERAAHDASIELVKDMFPQPVALVPGDFNRLRQWFNSMEDTNPKYIEDADRELYDRILKVCRGSGVNTTDAVMWTEAETVADRLENEIRNLIEDPTADNATCLVRSVMNLCRNWGCYDAER
ncbi:hypothetical protein [Trabulsiella odontotermitis]|uniref:hypothetical protein n=1 Tax=Trabulsiella odontotermitis TaxID=379893 RepID=UPI00067653FD|nr:hypothetical protein [Trabulsiella odontotermitis]